MKIITFGADPDGWGSGDMIRQMEAEVAERRLGFEFLRRAARRERQREQAARWRRVRMLLICLAVIAAIGAAAVVYVDAVMR